MTTLLADPTQLAGYMQRDLDTYTAELAIQIASGAIRRYLRGQQIVAVDADLIILNPRPTLWPITGRIVTLPQRPVTDVTLVETTTYGLAYAQWVAADPTQYLVDMPNGTVTLRDGIGIVWPVEPGTVRVTYSHGLDEVPDDLMGVCLGTAARIINFNPGIQSEKLGNYDVRYEALAAQGFSPLDQIILDDYDVPGVA